VLPCVPQLQTLPPCRGGLRRYHVAPTSPPREESSGAATYPTTRPFFIPVVHGPQRVVDHRNKESSSYPKHAVGLACVQSTDACYRGACKACGYVAIVRFNSATQTQ
jgi:hypothetical protein